MLDDFSVVMIKQVSYLQSTEETLQYRYRNGLYDINKQHPFCNRNLNLNYCFFHS